MLFDSDGLVSQELNLASYNNCNNNSNNNKIITMIIIMRMIMLIIMIIIRMIFLRQSKINKNNNNTINEKEMISK